MFRKIFTITKNHFLLPKLLPKYLYQTTIASTPRFHFTQLASITKFSSTTIDQTPEKISQSLSDAKQGISTEPRMLIACTCNVCKTRLYKGMSKKAYQKGVVIIRCDGCQSLHLIADHLGWFDSQSPPGTLEDIMNKKGEKIKRLSTPELEELKLIYEVEKKAREDTGEQESIVLDSVLNEKDGRANLEESLLKLADES
ncbi:hypothetical protein HK096_003946, partial [Nowakowskiella sp. JEL0078]